MAATATRSAPDATVKDQPATCYHCGALCLSGSFRKDDKDFCCNGCKLVYELLDEKGLCEYYELSNHPGLSQIKPVRTGKYEWLDNEAIAAKFYTFTDGDTSIVTFYIPGIHCSSCMWLLENLQKLQPGIIESRTNFTAKEVTIRFRRSIISLRSVVELLATIGYEPYLNVEATKENAADTANRKRIYRLGVAGFCFGNIMMLSFPEYLSLGSDIETKYALLFRYLSLALALPVFFYSSREFFVAAWKGLKQRALNIDTPVALAILITFSRSLAEILSGSGSGYLDSMSGVVFFMLVGRAVQERTYRSISFHRDYKSYFPVAVSVATENGFVSKTLNDLQVDDVVQLYNDEIVPADSMALDEGALIDYSFVTGESAPVKVKKNDVVYAGGRQVGGQLTVKVLKPVAGSYLTSLWNHKAFSKDKREKNEKESIVHAISKNFTLGLLILVVTTGIYWAFIDPSRIMASMTAMLIVACPCALLLASTFTNGNMLRIFSDHGLYLRDASVIEQLASVNRVVFDKTGTLTRNEQANILCSGHVLTEAEKNLVYSVVKQSSHPMSKALAAWLGARPKVTLPVWQETPGSGIYAKVDESEIFVGSASFVNLPAWLKKDAAARVYIRINDRFTSVHFRSIFRDAAIKVVNALKRRYTLSLLSGDNEKQKEEIGQVLGTNAEMLFHQQPQDKLAYIERLQQTGSKVLMIGDGLNDSGALQQSDVGITLSDDINNFTPACDAVLDARRLANLPALMRLAKASGRIINICFGVSVIYNVVGLWFAMNGRLKPVMAAVLMPASTLSIVLITIGAGALMTRLLQLKTNTTGEN